MDFFKALTDLKDASGKMAIEKGQAMTGSPGHGKPEDYGFKGRARNARVTPRMAGGGIMNALAGTIADVGVKALDPYIDSGMNALASSIRGSGTIASR